MNQKSKLLVSTVILVIVLAVMYTSNFGIPGIAQYWQDFKLLDMQFLYSIDTVKIMITQIGPAGIKHYLYYFVIDVIFIITLLYVQLQLSKKVTFSDCIRRKILYFFAIGRCIFDILEDTILTGIMKEFIPLTLVPVASAITTFKFICLILWCIVVLQILVKRRTHFKIS